MIEEEGRKWYVVVPSDRTLPGSLGVDVYLALVYLTFSRPVPKRTIHFSIYEILSVLGLSTSSGENYRRVAEELRNLASISITTVSFFRAPDRTVEKIEGLRLFESLTLKNEGFGENSVTWDHRLWENFQAGFVNIISLTFLLSLRPLTRLLYRFLRESLGERGEGEFSLHKLCSYLGLSRLKYPSWIMKNLRPALDELKRKGIIDWEYYEKEKKVKISMRKEALPEELMRVLKEIGIMGKGMEDIAKAYARNPKFVAAWTQFILREKNRFRNPAGFLIYILANEENFPPEGDDDRYSFLKSKYARFIQY